MEQSSSWHSHGIDGAGIIAITPLHTHVHDSDPRAGSADTVVPKTRADSLYHLVTAATITTGSGASSHTATKVYPIPGKDVLRFLMPPNPRHTRHYFAALSAIQARLQAAVAAVVPDGQMPWDKLVFQPMMVGKNEQDAKLHMAVLCEPSLARILEDAFTNGPVRNELGIPNSDESLGYIIIPEPHEEVNAHLAIDIFSQTRYDAIHNTYCGAPLFVKHREQVNSKNFLRQATFGGIIKVVYANGKTHFYGMTAGHVTRTISQHRNQLSTSSPVETDSAQGPFSASAWLSSEDALSHPLDPDQLPGVTAQRTKPSHDWCIFGTKTPRCNRAVHARRDGSLLKIADNTEDGGHPILIAERPSFNDDTSDPVLLLGAAAGTRRGTLSSLPSSIWMASCQSFVSVYVLQMSGGQKVAKGDSGAWVVHAAGPALYGHVVATNTFGEAYVIPANDAFENIKECLGAVSVTLPTAADLASGCTIESSPHFKQVPRHQPKRTSSQQMYSRKAHQILHGVKEWKRFLFNHRPIYDRTLLDVFQELNTNKSIIDFFLHDIKAPNPSWRVKQELSFLNETKQQHVTMCLQVYLDDKYRDVDECRAKWIGVDEVRSHLKRPKGWSYDLSRGIHRRLIFVPNLVPEVLLGLLKTVSYHQAETLRCAVRTYTTSAICLRIHVSTHGFPSYRLEFNLPYFTVSRPSGFYSKQSRDIDFGVENLRPDREFTDFSGSVHERYASVTISGHSHSSWYGYAFGSLQHPEAEVLSSDEESECDEDCCSNEIDFFATAGCEPTIPVSGPIWDPRMYFLRTLQFRLDIAVQANEYLVHIMETNLKTWMTKVSKKQSPSEDLETILNAKRLFSHLKDRFRKVNQAWDRFCRSDGDILYFSDMDAHDLHVILHKIEEKFEKSADLEEDLARMIRQSEAAIHILQLQMTYENNKLSLESNALGRTMVGINLKTSRYSEHTAMTARVSQAMAEDASRGTRLDVQLFMITATIVIALQYFTAEQSLFAFERNGRTFFISIAILTPSLFLLTYLLQIVDRVRDSLSSRILGKIDNVPAVPTCESSGWDRSTRVSDAETLHEKHGKFV